MNVNTNVALGLLTVILYLPSGPVTVPVVLPFSVMLTPGSGVLAESVTVPVTTDPVCAESREAHSRHSNSMHIRLHDLVIVLCIEMGLIVKKTKAGENGYSYKA
jgi:hypothetical protein